MIANYKYVTKNKKTWIKLLQNEPFMMVTKENDSLDSLDSIITANCLIIYWHCSYKKVPVPLQEKTRSGISLHSLTKML